MSQKSVAQLKKTADTWFSKYVRYRDSELINGEYAGECITCSVRKPMVQMQNGHFVSRRVNALRFDERNCNMQCVACNVYNYGEQYAYSSALDDKYGDGTAAELWSRRFESHKFTVAELQQIIDDAKEQVKFYESNRDENRKPTG